MTDFSEDRCRRIRQKVLDIMAHNELSRDEIQLLFKNSISPVENDRVLQAAEQIYSLFLEEKLSIAEGVSVMTAVKPLALELK